MKSSREVREAATLAERERIIKLLHSELSRFMWVNVGEPIAALGYANVLAHAIRLIKDEDK